VKIVCVGDSITYGQNVRADQAWPAILASRTSHDVRNEGVCGDTTRLGLERFPKAAQLHRPDVVIIQFGHNDANCWETDHGVPRVSKDAYAANLWEMVARANAMGAEWLLIQPHYAPGKTVEYNQRLASYWQQVGILGIEPPSVTVLDDGYGLHPDGLMHERYAELVLRALS
jgi:lysophospholipase L1-like esterase